MRLRIWLLAMLALALTVAPARAQFGESEKVLTATPALSATAVKPGQTIPAAVVLTLQPGWHVNSNKPAQDFLQPTVVTLKPGAGLTAGAIEYPPARNLKLSFSPDPLSVFEDKAVVRFPVTVAASAAPGKLTLSGTVSYQPCNQTSCYAPADKPFTLIVPVAGPNDTVAPANTDLFGAGGAPPSGAAGGNRWADALSQRGLLAFLALIFLGGLALNLTPCVYPMIAVTMSVFGAQAGQAAQTGQPRGRVLGKAIVYVLGMAVMYTALGLFAALTGSLFGGLLQSKAVQLFIAAFLAAMALGMFGLFELQMPPRLAMALGGVNRVGLAGIFVSGLVVGLFAAPCVGPVVLGLLALVGAKHDPAFGAVSFFTLALGLGAPYIVLASFTGLLTRLPRSGGWMEHVKHVFGIILMAVAVRYALLALARSYADFVTAAALVILAWYVLTIPAGDRARRWLAAAGVLAALVAGASGYQTWSARRPAAAAAAWPVYSDAALAEALGAGKPVVMDFSASWCAECRQLEHETFSRPEVQQALEPFARFRVDLDGANKPQADELQRKWSVRGLPAIVFLDPSGREIPEARVGGFLPPDQFLKSVAAARS